MNFLPEIGVCGVAYLCRRHDLKWQLLTWDGGLYHVHSTCDTEDQLLTQCDALPWLRGWERLRVKVPTQKMRPCKEVRFTFTDGRVMTLVGDQANTWFRKAQDAIARAELQEGHTQFNWSINPGSI